MNKRKGSFLRFPDGSSIQTLNLRSVWIADRKGEVYKISPSQTILV